MTKRLITVGHSPDPDDAFMFYALAHDKIDTGALQFRHELQDIETLNRRALRGELDVSGSHTFAAFKNAHHITVDIYDVGGSMATVTDTVTDPPAGKSKQNSTFLGTSNPTQGPGLNAGQAVWTSLLEPGGSVGGRLEQAAAAIASLPEHSYPLEGDAARVSLAARLEDVLWQRMGAEELPEGEIVFG